ncbi:hypothetical protein LX64_00796 [Chitinophaga skermanii]|uniref:Uncharacterized protein n=1 Tax=Chitinophaga skermanii TaxID=331697 RepID=A0A327R517_9BACT|nr:hypothetical protein [Chitinophaga skermanii]RAJ11188.1 hypothetical protein LX64_00796 [Chitinophaga skermanii]
MHVAESCLVVAIHDLTGEIWLTRHTYLHTFKAGTIMINKMQNVYLVIKYNTLIPDLTLQLLIKQEFNLKTLRVTQQYLEIMDVHYDDGLPTIERISRSRKDGITVAYVKVVNEHFYLAVYIDEANEKIVNIGTEARNTVVFRAKSKTLSGDHLAAMTTLPIDFKQNKGDLLKFSLLDIAPSIKVGPVEEKLSELLDLIATDKEGVANLVTTANGNIQVIMDFHGGNQILGGVALSEEHIQKMAQLNLSFNFFVTSWGKRFK